MVVIGAGPAGCVCAFRLARLGYDVVLVAWDAAAGPREGETCGPEVLRVLQEAGIPEPDEEIGLPLEAFLSAWGTAEIDGRSFAFWHGGLALVLKRPVFERWLLGGAKGAGVRVIGNGEILGGVRAEHGWVLSAKIDGQSREISAGFVVDATGRIARSLLQPDVRRVYTDRLVCLIAEVAETGPERSSAIVESCPSGWWFSAPLPDDRRLIALFTDSDLVGPPADRASDFFRRLSATEHLRHIGDRAPRGLGLRLRDARSSARTVLWRGAWMSIGDAAWSIDPLSGNGIQRVVVDGFEAASAIASFLANGDSTPLCAHATARGTAFREALRIQRRFYDMERRWPQQPFWQRRLGRG